MYKSQAQEAYFNIHKAELERQGVHVEEWNKAPTVFFTSINT